MYVSSRFGTVGVPAVFDLQKNVVGDDANLRRRCPMRTKFGSIVLLFAMSCQTSGPASSRLHFSASLDGAKIKVLADGETGSIDLGPQLAGISLIGSHVIFSARNERGIFLVIDFVSRSSSPTGDCGSGTEENLVWVAFDRSLRPVNFTSTLIASCLQSIDVTQVQQDERSIIVTSDASLQHIRRFVFFRKSAPELGFTFQKTELAE